MTSHSSVLKQERLRRISETVKAEGRAAVSDLAHQLGVSEMTIRRDLQELDAQGLVQRIHGGALVPQPRRDLVEPPMLERIEEQAAVKWHIARAVAEMVEEGETIFLGSGTTTLAVAEALTGHDNLTVITNALAVANRLAAARGITVIVVGGFLCRNELSLVGHFAEAVIRDLRVNKVIMGARGVDAEYGLTITDLQELGTNQAIMEIGDTVIIVADHTKFGKVGTSRTAPVTAATMIVTDTRAPTGAVEAIRAMGVRVIQVLAPDKDAAKQPRAQHRGKSRLWRLPSISLAAAISRDLQMGKPTTRREISMGDDLSLASYQQQMESEAERIAEHAQKAGVTLRLIGALAFERQCPRYNYLREAMGRVLSDLDFAALSSQWDQIVGLLTGMGYAFDERGAMLHGADRIIFFHPEDFRVDVFFDRLDMCHRVDFHDRLHIDPVTISITDLLLEKLQIVELTRKDVIDTLVLLREHEVGRSEAGINAGYVARRFGSDWGFYYTATENLKHIRNDSLDEFDALKDEDRSVVRERVGALLERIEEEPKSLFWRMRAVIGPSLRWYRPVGELSR